MVDQVDSSTFRSEIYHTILNQPFKEDLAGTEICQKPSANFKNVKSFLANVAQHGFSYQQVKILCTFRISIIKKVQRHSKP